MNVAGRLSAALLAIVMVVGCGSSRSPQKAGAKGGAPAPGGPIMAQNTQHPLARFVEVAGFRITERKAGRLRVDFAVINHSNADVNDLGLNVSLSTTIAKPGEPPFCVVTVTVPSLPSESMKDATGECPTNLRVYELPDWQFLRSEFQITSP
jgi:hypothetical protein